MTPSKPQRRSAEDASAFIRSMICNSLTADEFDMMVNRLRQFGSDEYAAGVTKGLKICEKAIQWLNDNPRGKNQ